MRTHCQEEITGTENDKQEKNGSKSMRRKYQCDYCGKQFKSWEYFKVHLRGHSERSNLKCDICSKEFSALPCLRSHMNVHTGEKRFW